MNNEIGGFIELEIKNSEHYHKNAIYINSARNGIKYLIKAHRIKIIHVPYYTCPVVWQAIQEEECKIIPYKIDLNFLPTKEFGKNDYILYTNYFGICTKNILELEKRYNNIIIDNAMAFYSKNYGLGCVYSPRKFFGVPDGGIVITKKRYDKKFNKNISYNRFLHLLMRVDCGSNFAYQEFNKNDDSLNHEPIEEMSNLTYKMLKGIDYDNIKKKRINNFKFLAKNLINMNDLKLNISRNDVPMYYPLLNQNSSKIRTKLLENNIYCPKPWRELLALLGKEPCKNERILYENLIPLIIDQRYGKEEMKKIVEIVRSF